ncbi:hypothetical protein ACNS7O_13120 [Haloferacaceae archaeon DSL9]
MSADSGPGRREIAYRLFAAEYDDASLSYSESDEERAPNYVVTPTGARLNRIFVAGVLTEVEAINDDTRRGRIVDPTGAFVTYAGQYQPDEAAVLGRLNPPAFVALAGKARTFEPEDGDRVYTSVRPESISEVDAATRDRWVVSAAEATLDRLAIVAKALASDLRGDDLERALRDGGAAPSLAAGIPRAIDHYGTTTAYLEAVRQLATDALEVITGDRSEVRSLSVAPDGGGDVELGPLPETDVTIDEEAASAGEASAEADVDSAPAETAPPESEAAAGEEIATAAEADGSATERELPATERAAGATAAEEPVDSATEDAVSTGVEAASTTAETAEIEEPTADAASGPGETTAESPESDAGSESAESSADSNGGDGASELDDDGMYQLDENEREELEAEFGAEFTSGNDVDDPGEAGIDVPDADDLAAELESEADPDAAVAETTQSDSNSGLGDFEDLEPEPASESDSAGSADSDVDADGVDTGATGVDTDADGVDTDGEVDLDDVDLEAVVVETMSDLDDGDGAEKEAVVASVVDECGAEPSVVEDAIQDALMSGKCYEPAEETYKAI